MNTQELIGVTSWIDAEIKRRNIPQTYLQLAALLQNTANGSPQPIEAQKEQLIQALASVDLPRLTNEQREFLDKLKLLKHLGAAGVAELENTLFRNSLDVATAASRVAAIAADFQSGVDRSDQIKQSLSDLIEISVASADEVLIRVVFDQAAAINDIADFKKWAAEWHDIGRGIAMAVGATPKDIHVVGAQSGSIIIELATAYGIAQVVATVILKSLEVTEKVLKIRKAVLDIERLKLDNKKLAADMSAEADAARKAGIDNVVEDVKQSVERQLDGEAISALEKSVRKLLAFLEKGGEVDVVLPLEDVEADEDEAGVHHPSKTLRNEIHQIRVLESEIRALTHESGLDAL